METFLTRAITIVALTCVLVVGAAATSILGRDSVPAVPAHFAAAAVVAKSPDFQPPGQSRQAAGGHLCARGLRAAASSALARAAASGLCRRRSADLVPNLTAPAPAAAPVAAAPVAPPKPKAVAKPAPQKNYALLSDVQIAGIKERLKLSPDQEAYWPGSKPRYAPSPARSMRAEGNPSLPPDVPIDPEAEEVAQLKSAAMPLLFQFRDDQKSEVRSLARIIGLEHVAAMI